MFRFESHEDGQSTAHKMRSLLQASVEVNAESGKLGFPVLLSSKTRKESAQDRSGCRNRDYYYREASAVPPVVCHMSRRRKWMIASYEWTQDPSSLRHSRVACYQVLYYDAIQYTYCTTVTKNPAKPCLFFSVHLFTLVGSEKIRGGVASMIQWVRENA